MHYLNIFNYFLTFLSHFYVYATNPYHTAKIVGICIYALRPIAAFAFSAIFSAVKP